MDFPSLRAIVNHYTMPPVTTKTDEQPVDFKLHNSVNIALLDYLARNNIPGVFPLQQHANNDLSFGISRQISDILKSHNLSK